MSTAGNGVAAGERLPLADRPFRALARLVGTIGRMPGAALLAGLFEEAAAEVVAERRAAAGALGERIAAGDGAARAELTALGDAALVALREAVAAAVARRGPMRKLALAYDRRWNRPELEEYLDDPDFDRYQRLRIMAELDHMNEVIGSYPVFLDVLEPLLASGRTTRVLDLAAGHGGFSVAAARLARRRGYDIAITASDLKTEYLELGAAQARAERLPIDFVGQDALDLSNLSPGDYDIITCTQSLHHFSPGMIAVMFEAAARVAGRGVVFVDACRSTLIGVALGMYSLLRLHNPAFAHDSWVSSRRFYLPEELGLLARLGPWGDRVEAPWVPPGHCMIRLSRDR